MEQSSQQTSHQQLDSPTHFYTDFCQQRPSSAWIRQQIERQRQQEQSSLGPPPAQQLYPSPQMRQEMASLQQRYSSPQVRHELAHRPQLPLLQQAQRQAVSPEIRQQLSPFRPQTYSPRSRNITISPKPMGPGYAGGSSEAGDPTDITESRYELRASPGRGIWSAESPASVPKCLQVRANRQEQALQPRTERNENGEPTATDVLPTLPVFQSHFNIIPYDYYGYQSLTGSQEIRILRINPGQQNTTLDCELYHTAIPSNQEYNALSYAWGDKSSMTEIECNGKRLRITSSLCGALQRIRSVNHPVHVWADAICINQQDVTERGHQVRLMRSIYKRAKTVLIWLGPDESLRASTVFGTARRIFAKDPVKVPPAGHPIWREFDNLFRRAWFWRLWCLQEIVLASAAEIMWGAESISWECLGFTAAWIRTVGYQILRKTPISGVHNAYLMYALSLSSDKHDPVSFLHLLTLTRQFQVSDPRDRIYALLGLPTTDSNPDEGELYIDPDYSKSTSEVYEVLARRMLLASQGLRTLSAVQHGLEVETKLPSWIPQWDRLFTYTLAQAGSSLKNHVASATLPLSIPGINGSILDVGGLEFDEATVVSAILPDSLDTPFPSDFEYIQTIWASIIGPRDEYPTGSDIYTAFCWTITAGKDWYGMLIENDLEHLADFAAFQDRHFISPLPDVETRARLISANASESVRQRMMSMPKTEFYNAIAAYNANGARNTKTGATDLTNEPLLLNADADRFITALSYACRWRRFFVTQKGFMGIGPPCMREGDVVCILSGGIVPFLLRPGGQHYKLVGEAYIYGIMGGEACEQPLRGDLELRTFSLS